MPTLTEAFIKATSAPEKGNKIHFDDHRDAPPGFGLRVTKAGGRAFVLRYRPKDSGRDRLLTIGPWPTWSLAAARKQAREFRRQVDAGQDILQERREKAAAPLLAAVVHEYCESQVDGKLKSAQAVRSCLERYLVAGLGPRKKFAEIKRAEVIRLVERLAAEKYRQAQLLLTYTKQLFAWAEDRELITANPVASIKPKRVDPKLASKQHNRGRILDETEIRALWDNAETCGMHRLTALALKMILITGQRPGEVAGMRFDEIKRGVWEIPAERRGKTGTAHAVPLTKTALALVEFARQEVERLNKRRWGDPAGFIFEARPGSGVTIGALDRAVKRFTGELKNQNDERWGHWTPHDLRRTCRTGLSACGIGHDIAEITIGHTLQGVRAVYDLHGYDTEKLTALEAWERRLLRIIEGKPADDSVVVPLRAEAVADA